MKSISNKKYFLAVAFSTVLFLYCTSSFAFIPSQKLLQLAKNAKLSTSVMAKVVSILENGDKKHAKLLEKAIKSKQKLIQFIKGKSNEKENLTKGLQEYTQVLTEIENNKYLTLYSIKEIISIEDWQKIIQASENIKK